MFGVGRKTVVGAYRCVSREPSMTVHSGHGEQAYGEHVGVASERTAGVGASLGAAFHAGV